LELFSSGEGEGIVDEGTEWVLFLDAKVWVGRLTGFDIELPFTSREPGGVPTELDLNIDALLISFNGRGPLDTGGVRGGWSITPNSDGLGTLLSDGLVLSVRGPGVEGREGCDRRTGRDRVMYGSLGGKGGGSISSSSRVEGNRVLADEVVLRLLLLIEDRPGRDPSADSMVGVLERDPVAYCDLREANEDVREMAIDERRRVRGDGESSSSLYACSVSIGVGCGTRLHTYHSIPTLW